MTEERPPHTHSDDTSLLSLSERFDQAVGLVSTCPTDAVGQLTSLQDEIAALSLFSSNETLDDIATSSLPFLGLEHYLAKALVEIPTGFGTAQERLYNLQRAADCWQVFLERLDQLEQLSREEQDQYRDLLELSSRENVDNGDVVEDRMLCMPPPISRDVKIARFRAQQAATQEAKRLKALQDRRSRLGVKAEDEMDGHDDESLARAVALTNITQICKAQALEEWSAVLQELPLVSRMVQSQARQQAQDSRYGSRVGSHSRAGESLRNAGPPPQPSKPLEVTRITQDPTTGQLRIQRQEIKSNVFRPGWNQPTMTLEELAEKEVQQALEREARQKEAEAARKNAPRRYDQLVRDGMEDNADLVDASAALDRQWDNFKDENPRGSGNKRGDVGDRNF